MCILTHSLLFGNLLPPGPPPQAEHYHRDIHRLLPACAPTFRNFLETSLSEKRAYTLPYDEPRTEDATGEGGSSGSLPVVHFHNERDPF